jgi:hypothetical protein
MAGSDSDAGEVSVTFHPQEWVDSPGEAHDWDRRQLVPADDRDPVTFTVPRADATDAAGEVFADKSYEANMLQSHAAAPDWVNDWDGPYYVRTQE